MASALQPTLFSRLGADEESAGPDVMKAMERAGRYLALRARSEKELTDSLLRGFDGRVVAEAIERLKNLRLIDDLEFSREWIEQRSERRHIGSEALLRELDEKGIDPETARLALEESGIDEIAAARAWALKQIKRLAKYPIGEQGGRLVNSLLRRGFTHETAEEAARSVLPPDGWD